MAGGARLDAIRVDRRRYVLGPVIGGIFFFWAYSEHERCEFQLPLAGK